MDSGAILTKKAAALDQNNTDYALGLSVSD